MTSAAESVVPTRVGWLGIWMAASVAMLFGLRLTQTGEFFCGAAPCPELLVAALPLYLTFFAMVLPTIPLAAATLRITSAPTAVRLGAIVCAGLVVIDVIVLILATYDQMWSNYLQPGTLDQPRRAEHLAPEVRSVTSLLWPALIGAWLVFVTIALTSAGLPRSTVVIGLSAGAGIIAAAAAGQATSTYGYAEPIALVASFFWGAWLGLGTLLRRGSSRRQTAR